MHSVQTGLWNPRPPSKHASPIPAPPPFHSRPAHVTSTTPAKRITFYKSGDSQFGGVRMAIHKRSFKCFDALLDDLSQKVPLPFGVRTVTTPRGTHAIKQLEQLQDGGCYLCSDRRQAKPVNMELVNKQSGIWYHHSRRPHRPETSSTTPPGHLHTPYRQRRILLVKNSEPGMRRSVVLSRRSARSLRAFLDEVSDVMQFHVRKLYTAEGRRIDSVQSLMTCPGVLVCVGREAFSPMLINFIRKSSEEKLPGLGNRSPGLGPRTPGNGARSPATQGVRSPPHGAQSRASEYSEGRDSKKNVNFGLETKKSIIHPRSDSSNRSARFSFSSEKSYGNGVSTFPQAKPAIMNDDIEKRVLVNKDGSLSVEMRVRFRLQSDETLQWSTQIKKSPSLTNEYCPLSQAQPHYLQQGQSESCSDPDSTSFDQEGADYSSQPLQCELEGNRCPCCHQRHEQQYDLWENPAHSHKSPPVPPTSNTHAMMRHTHSSSSSSSCNSRRVVRCRAGLSSCGGGSGSEQSQLVQEEMCVTERVEHRLAVEQDGDTHVEVHKVSRCCSRSEVVVMDSNLRPLSRKSAEEEEDRPLSAVSSSSHVLRSLKEDQDDEEDDLPPSVSQCCHGNEPSPTPDSHQHERPRSSVSAGSFQSVKHKEREQRGSGAVSAASSCPCGETGGPNEVDQVLCTASKISETRLPELEEGGAGDDDKETKRAVSGLSGHTGLSANSHKSGTSSVCPNCGGCKRKANSVSNGRASHRSNHSNQASPNRASPVPDSDDAASDVSTQSNKTNLTNNGRLSATSNILEGKVSSAVSRTSSPKATGKEEERAPSATTSHRSSKSHNSGCRDSTDVTAEKEEERSPSVVSNQSAKSSKSKHTTEAPDMTSIEKAEGENAVERAVSSLSARSCVSAKTKASVKSCNSNCQSGFKGAPQSDNPAVEECDTNKRAPSSLSVKSGKAERPDSARSTKSNISVKSSTSHRSTCSNCAKAAAGEATIKVTGKEEEKEVEERATSAMSAKSNLSAKSNKSHKSTKASEGSEARGDGEERAPSQMSGTSVKTDKSVKSTKSSKSKCNGNETLASSSSKTADEAEENNNILEVETQPRPDSTMLAKSESNERAPSAGSPKCHLSSCNQNTESSSEIVHNAGNQEDAEKRAASALSHKSASSAKSHNTKIEEDGTGDRAPSAKSSKSQKSNHSAASPVPSDANEERVVSVMSAKSKSSMRSKTSHKSNSSANVATIKTPVADDKEADVTKERAPSAASGTSNVSSAVSQKSNYDGKADITVIETADGDEKAENTSAPKIKSSEHFNLQTLSPKRTRSPKMHSPDASAASTKNSKSPVQQLLNASGAGETRGASALSVHSTTSAKSGKSKCCCGAPSERDKAKTEKEDEDKEAKLEVKSEKSSERAASALSSAGVDQLLSHNSTESVSLGLPEETSDSDSGKSSVLTRAEGQAKPLTPDLPKDPEVSTMKEDVEITGSTVSQKSNRTGRKSESAMDIPTIETPASEENGVQKREKVESTISVKSSRSNKSSCNCKAKEKHTNASLTKAGNGNETGTVKSAPMTNDSSDRNSSAMSSASAKVRSKSSASANAVTKTAAGQSANDETENQENSRVASEAKGKEDNAYNKAISSQSPCCLRPESASLASEQSKGKDPFECHKAKFSTGSDCVSVKTANSKTKETSVKSSSPCPLHSKVETYSESTLSHSLSAADLLKETMAAARPCSQQSKASKSSDRSRSKKSGTCRSSNQKDKGEELTPACLPNTSPSEVVSDWLRSIPANSSMLALGDEFNEEELRAKKMEEIPGESKESPEGEKIDKVEKVEPEEDKEKEDEAKCDIVQEGKDSDPASGEAEQASGRPGLLHLGSETLPRNWQSSAAVMKVLLSSSLGRCRSMPEVSPVYGRRLSTSARGLLDCLAQLQLIEPAGSPGYEPQKGRSQQYEDIMAILHSLWLTEPGIIDAKEATEKKDSSPEQVTPPRSSSGVDMSSGSGGSGKENGNQGGNETPPKERESPNAHEVAEKAVEEQEEENAKAGDAEIETDDKETFAEQAKEVTAEEPVQSEEVLQRMDSPKPSESSDKTSAEGGSKSATDNERETLEESGPATPPTVLRAPLAKRPSQDPDPVWVLHLLKKLEKQFMAHYINAMAEFKVRWDLDDSLILDTMITELKDEVNRRIQSSIEREIRKIQSRAGRGGRSPRPPQGTNLSRESTTTEKRRRMLKVMKNQSVKTGDSISDGETTGDFSDQRSDDEYCPCEACVRKKMAARPFNTNPLAAEAPVMKDFDLLKILQLKKSPGPAPAPAPQPVAVEGEHLVADDDGRNLDAVQEEEEEDETKEDIRPAVVLEETIAEEDEEVEQEKDEREAREEEESGDEQEEEESGDEQEEEEESSACEEEQEEEGTSGEEAREDDASGNGGQEEKCQCKCARNEEESDQEEEGEGQTGEDEGETGQDETEENEGEMGTSKEEEESSDQDTIKEETVGKGETTENGESDEEVDEKEKYTDSKSEEEEDDSAAKTTENEQSTLVEEGNISASAEDEDDGEDGTGEEEESTEDKKEGERDEQDGEASEEERTSPQGQGANPAVCTTEGEEADGEDSDADSKRPSDTGADESGCEEKEESRGDGDEEQDTVKEFKPEEEDEEKANGNKRDTGALLHQFTRTSVESQPGSLDDIDTDSPQNPVDSIEVPKMADSISTGGGKGQRRSRSPARVKRCKPKEVDDKLDSF